MAAPSTSNVENTSIHVWDDTNNTWVALTGSSGGGLTVNIDPANGLSNGQKTVTLAGTAEALGASTAILSITIKALRANTGNVYVGDSGVTSANGLVLERGASVSLDVDNLADVFIDVDTNGEGVSFLYLTA